ncbi:hypothetical protein LJ753_11615 [Arthrobacter sp. zg-Y20]|uniref:hypothetical protein n=1 Tax=unclassified Arthrobacter TaxID=235627 RepID=UPI001D1352A4|nr:MULTISPECIES: hypothetical protein [unclassified Arthrobacter]MCC3276515.1 hypothetical protein [Arthrobacter sp. zg-Y20]MDK1316675.1 hypothetical protein [Arthrobacter sp. zg.Y20]WIB06902.1 hypothetical protein QNO06_03985 [Arthrobacter sp. zg-Y20]
MNKKMRLLAVPTLALGAVALSTGPAMAHGEDSWSSQATLNTMNNSGTTGQAMVEVHGTEAQVTVNVSGAAETFMDGPFPHAQHIHIAAQGVCPGPDADTDGDGVVNTTEGHPFYGHIGTSLTTEGDSSPDSALAVERFPGGSSYTYERTLELSPETAASLKDGSAVVVVHGVDPSRMPEAAAAKMSDLDPSLPAAATLPAACGTLVGSQMADMPAGGADTGVESDNGAAGTAVAGAGFGFLALAGAAVAVLRRRARA